MFCYQKFQDAQSEEGVEPVKVDPKCVCFEKEKIEPDPKMGIEGGTVSLLLSKIQTLQREHLRVQNEF